jgi:uncharacterized protein YggE
MKKFMIILASLVCLQLNAQQSSNPFPKTITVSGSAEMELVPDEIYVQVELKEYQKKGEKFTIDRIKSDFLRNLKNLGIPDSAVSIASYEGANGSLWWRKKKKDKDDELMATIAYQVKLDGSAKVDQLVNVLDDDATSNFSIIQASHSKINEYRKQLKIQAIKAAREKAIYLADAINEKIGEAISILEPNDDQMGYFLNSRMSNRQVNQDADANDESQIDFKKIKLRFSVNLVFALK